MSHVGRYLSLYVLYCGYVFAASLILGQLFPLVGHP